METQTVGNADSNRQSQMGSGSLFERKIEFHLARKPFSGVVNFDNKFQLETLNPTAPTGNLGKGTMATTQLPANKTEGLNLGRKGFDPELSFGITFRRIGAGLENLGNTCFLNSVLQCLTYTEPLVAYLQSGRHQSSCQIAGFCALCAIQKHVTRALHATGRSLAPKDLVSNLRCISRTFRNARQEDAHEYMVHLLESMHRCCLPKGVPSESPSAYEKSLVHKIFGGRLQSQVQCMQCSYCSNKYDPFLDLSLEIARADTLQKALVHFTAKEQLDGGAKQYQCQQCKQKVRAVKQLTVHEAPYVLTVHLKRFCAHDPRQKIDKKVMFSPTLDLKPFVSGSHEGSLMYTLYGVLVHAGWSTRSGHYYCFVRTSTGMWYSLDDNRVVQVNERTVLDQKAYMLFYVRDRSNAAPKKPSNVALNERMGSLANGNNILLSLTKGFEGLGQNGSLEKYVGENSVTALKDAINAKKETKEGVSFIDSTTATNSSELNIIQPELAVVQLQKGSKILNHPAEVESLQPNGSCSNIESSIGTRKIVSNEENHPQKNVTVSASILPNCSMPQFTGNGQPFISEKPPLILENGSLWGEGVSSDSSRKTPDLEAGTNMSAVQPMNLPISSKTNNQFKVRESYSMIKNKKRLAKPFVITLRLSINVMAGSTGGLCKKKLKRSRQTILKNRSYKTEKILEDIESTSHTVSVALPFRQRKMQSLLKEKLLDPAKEETYSRNTLLKKNSGGCDAEANSSDVILAANKSLNFGLINGLRGDDSEHCAHSGVEKVSLPQTGLKRGLDEPIVACWDGTLSANIDMISMACESARIGYVPDEWDEEYDRGKRKKVKLFKYSFDGINPFQEFATIKATSKKSRDQSSSGNRPYRIA